ncbi:MAG: hypothetical protein E7439_02560 [Ruminococcaceae bacterium]|nr:hypothetical protein [Oscillospiraceae bacterium]
MLFRKKIEKSCLYCSYGTQLDEDTVLCTKRGLVQIGRKCRKFNYEPTKRVPPKPKAPDFGKYSEEDFSL